MYLEAYSIFEAVLKEKNYSAAARSLNLTPSAVSHSISAMEKRFGVRLFTRNGSTSEPTAACLELSEHILGILRMEDILQQQAGILSGKVSGSVSIGGFSSVCSNWLPFILRDFKAAHPDIRVSVQQGGYDDILEWIAKRSVDIAFVSSAIIPEKDDSAELCKDRFVCVTSKDYIPSNGKSVTAEDIRQLPIIAQRGENNIETEKLLERLKIRSDSDFAIEDDRTLVAMVSAGLGCCMLEELVVRNMHADVNLWPIEPEYSRTIRLKLTDPTFASPAARLFYRFIIDYLNSHPDLRR